MNTFVITETNAPLQRQQRECPTPKRGQVVVRNLATTVNFHDLLNIQGVIPNVVWPRVPFSDNCGEIIAVHEEESRWQIGDRVIANFFPDWLAGEASAHHCTRVYGDNLDGFLQAFTLVESSSLVSVPGHLSNVEASSFACAGLTAWRSVAVEANVRPGDVVVIQGTGGVSLFALQFAKILGAEVILTSSADAKLAIGKKLGADHLINYQENPDWDNQVLEMTSGRGADLIVEVGGADTFLRSVNAAKLNGHISVIGVRSGFGREISMPLELLLIKNLNVRGITVGSVEQLAAMLKAVDLHKSTPVIDSIYAVDDLDDAMLLMQAQKHVGKIAIDLHGL